jgi:hypothetical protein
MHSTATTCRLQGKGLSERVLRNLKDSTDDKAMRDML